MPTHADKAETKETAVATREAPATEAVAAEPYVDPYKQVIHPMELPANTAAAQAYIAANPGVVSEDVPISDERLAQATEAIQDHQDTVAAVSAPQEDPRLATATPSTKET